MADPRTTRPDDPLTAFGPNEWLVDELYQQYLEDKNSVDKAWWEFFADYTPDGEQRERQQRRRAGPGSRQARGCEARRDQGRSRREAGRVRRQGHTRAREAH